LNHVGLRVRDSEELVKIQHRREAAGIRTRREDVSSLCSCARNRDSDNSELFDDEEYLAAGSMRPQFWRGRTGIRHLQTSAKFSPFHQPKSLLAD
jgi:hypothetical protein